MSGVVRLESYIEVHMELTCVWLGIRGGDLQQPQVGPSLHPPARHAHPPRQGHHT